MKIALIGASGYVGTHLLKEALDRGHEVTAIARNAASISAQSHLNPVSLDIKDEASLIAALRGHEAVLLAMKCEGLDTHALLAAIEQAGVARLLVVGGAGSLAVAPGRDLVDSPDMQPQWKPEALAAREFLRRLRTEQDLDWSMISPSALLVPGERSAHFRTGRDELLRNDAGESRISLQDLALALIDELETPRHSRQRFTVGY